MKLQFHNSSSSYTTRFQANSLYSTIACNSIWEACYSSNPATIATRNYSFEQAECSKAPYDFQVERLGARTSNFGESNEIIASGAEEISDTDVPRQVSVRVSLRGSVLQCASLLPTSRRDFFTPLLFRRPRWQLRTSSELFVQK